MITNIQSKANLKVLSVTRSLTAKAKIVGVTQTREVVISGKVSIKVIQSNSITAKASIYKLDNIRTISVKASIKHEGVSRTIQAKANVIIKYKALGILPRFLNTKVDIKRKTTSKSTTGDLTNPFEMSQSSIPATIQLLTGEELANMQGIGYNYTHRAFLPKAVRNQAGLIIYVSVREGDRIYDQETEVTYRIKQIEDHIHAKRRKSGVKLHHYELLLEKLNDNRYI